MIMIMDMGGGGQGLGVGWDRGGKTTEGGMIIEDGGEIIGSGMTTEDMTEMEIIVPVTTIFAVTASLTGEDPAAETGAVICATGQTGTLGLRGFVTDLCIGVIRCA